MFRKVTKNVYKDYLRIFFLYLTDLIGWNIKATARKYSMKFLILYPTISYIFSKEQIEKYRKIFK